MDDPFLEVYERAAQGDVDGARARLDALREAGADPDRIADLRAFLDASGQGESAPLAGAHGDVTHPGHGLGAGPTRDAVPFRCLVCGVEEHIVRPVVLNRRFTTFFGFDMVDRSATTYACAGCGHIAWFGRASPGFVQAWADEDAARLEIEGGTRACRLCGFGALQSSKALLNTSLLTFLGLDWLDEGARTERCVRCGLLHWSGTHADTSSPWQDPGAKAPDGCPACGGRRLHAHKALLNTRAATAVGLDWLDRPAWVLRCADCRAMTWWARRPQEATA